MNHYHKFKKEGSEEIEALGRNSFLQDATKKWFVLANDAKYSYHFEWLGRPIIQYPQDIVALQELIWQIKPDLIIETGIAHGGSLIFSASMLALLDMAEAIENGNTLDPKYPIGRCSVSISISVRTIEKLLKLTLWHPE